MIKADKYYIQNLLDIKENGSLDVDPRPKYKDGTPAHTKFVTQVFEKYDISKGEYPITTIRNTAVKTGIKELLAIYQRQVNTQKGFEENGVFWWNEWMNEEGNIGRAYSHNLESHRPNEMKKMVCKIKKRHIDEKFFSLKEIVKPKLEESIDGVIYNTNYRNFGEYIIINQNNEGRRSLITCQFLKTGYITTIRKDSLRKNQHPMDNLSRTLFNIGYLDDYKSVNNFSVDEIKILKRKWANMIRRCYSDNIGYENIFVHQDWHSFKQFLIDVRYLPQYFLAKENNFENWELDKDYYGSNGYSKDTCVFLHKKENVIYRNTQIKPIRIIEDGVTSYELDYTSLSIKLGLSKGYLSGLVKKGKYKNFIFQFVEPDDDSVYRYELSRNEVVKVLDGLKKDPFGRRHIISLWNWANIDKKMLVECAYETLWTVRNVNGIMFLDMTLVQRSNDYITAGFINKIQYVALLMMVSGHLGYEPGVFCHMTQNLHVYDRHMNAVDELLERTPIDFQPKLILKEKKNFFDYTIDDFKIEGIEGITKINSELEIAV